MTPEHLFSEKCAELAQHGSEIRQMYQRGQRLLAERPELDLIDLSLGNPDLPPPAGVLRELSRLLAQPRPGAHRYMDGAGYPEVRAYLAAELSQSEGVAVSRDGVYLTVGAAGAMQIALRALLDEGDEVLLLAPYFPEYIPWSLNLGGRPVVVPGGGDHLPSLDAVARALSPRTRVVVVNSPNNPSGVVYPRSLLEGLARLLDDHQTRGGRPVHLLSDDPYARLIYDPSAYTPLLSLYPHTWLIRSFSKDLGLAGERAGFLAWGPALDRPETLPMLRNAGRATGFVNAPALFQQMIPAVYHERVEVAEYERRTRAFVEILRGGGLAVTSPQAGFFVFPRAPIADDGAFCDALLEDGVLAVPGHSFGAPGHVRVSLTLPLPRVEEGARRILRCAARVASR
jgi:aspartate aminotransferase